MKFHLTQEITKLIELLVVHFFATLQFLKASSLSHESTLQQPCEQGRCVITFLPQEEERSLRTFG